MQGNMHEDCKQETVLVMVCRRSYILIACLLALVGTVSLADADMTCGDIYFENDMYALTGAAKDTLRCHAALLSSHPTRKLRLEGHTDERGTPSYSLVFGERRAKSARLYLVEELGIARDRIVITSYGKEWPVCQEHTPACWARNRRVHVVVVDGTS